MLRTRLLVASFPSLSPDGWLLPQGWPGKPVKKYELGFNDKDQLKKEKKKKLSPAEDQIHEGKNGTTY